MSAGTSTPSRTRRAPFARGHAGRHRGNLGVLAAAFSEDPPFVWLLPDERRRFTQLRRFFALELRHVGLARGTVWTTEDLAGAALSMPPGRWRLPWTTQLRLGRAYLRAFGTRLPRATVLLGRMESRHPRRPHHYIPFVGIAPELQGRGLGTALMQPALDLCVRAGVPAYLEATCERNAKLYARLGFRLVDELDYGGSEPLRLMVRPPRGAGD